jgi:hypothetical protein
MKDTKMCMMIRRVANHLWLVRGVEVKIQENRRFTTSSLSLNLAQISRPLLHEFVQAIHRNMVQSKWPHYVPPSLRSPDLTPLDSLLWEYIKDTMYQTKSNDQPDLHHRIINAGASITPEIL